MLGYAPHPQKVNVLSFGNRTHLLWSYKFTLKRSSKKYTISGIFYTISLVIVESALIYFCHDPSKFTKATNSNILNYGIYIQTEVSLVLALWFLLRSSTKTSKKWTMNEQFSEIDKILKNEFSMNLCYKDVKLCETSRIM